MQANRFQTLVHYKIPAALPYFCRFTCERFLCFYQYIRFQNGLGGFDGLKSTVIPVEEVISV